MQKLIGAKEPFYFRGAESDDLTGIENEGGYFVNADVLDAGKDEGAFLVAHEWAHEKTQFSDGVKTIIGNLTEEESQSYILARFGKVNDNTKVWNLNQRYKMENDPEWLFKEAVSDAIGAIAYYNFVLPSKNGKHILEAANVDLKELIHAAAEDWINELKHE